MPPSMNRQILLRRRPSGMPEPGDFELVESPVPTPGEGEFLCRTIYLSLDPYMRGRISGGQSYAASVEPGQVIVGGTVGEVIESRHPGVAQGDLVLGYDGWQAYAVSRGVGVRKLDPEQAPISTALGVLGMPGMTAYVGLLDIGQPKPEETVVVSAASGAVGSELATAPDQPRADQGVHRLRPCEPNGRLPRRLLPLGARGEAQVSRRRGRRPGERPGRLHRPSPGKELREAPGPRQRRPDEVVILSPPAPGSDRIEAACIAGLHAPVAQAD